MIRVMSMLLPRLVARADGIWAADNRPETHNQYHGILIQAVLLIDTIFKVLKWNTTYYMMEDSLYSV